MQNVNRAAISKVTFPCYASQTCALACMTKPYVRFSGQLLRISASTSIEL